MHVRCVSAWPIKRAVLQRLRSDYIHKIEAVLYALMLESDWVLIEEKRNRLPRAKFLLSTLLYLEIVDFS